MRFLIGTPEITEDDRGYSIEAELHHGGVSPSLWFHVPQRYRPDEATLGDAFLAAMLPVAMARGEDVRVEAPVSARLLDSIDDIQSIYAGWYPNVLTHVGVEAAGVADATPAKGATVSTFTGGVDSFYTLVTHRDELDAVVYVEGFDVPLANRVLARTVRNTINAVADDYGKDVVLLSSNLKTFTDEAVSWPLVAHGPALASIGLLLQGHVDTMFIASTHSLKQMFPWGSHVLVDHLWSTDRLTVVHDGAQASRVDKTLAIKDESSAQRHLRVCWQNRGPYNCGRCEKCLRTMTALDLMGALGRFEVFPAIDLPAAVGSLRIANHNGLEFQRENLDFATERNLRGPLVDALRLSIDAYVARDVADATPFAGGKAAKNAALRAEVTRLRKENKRLTRELNSTPVARLWRRLGRLRRRLRRRGA